MNNVIVFSEIMWIFGVFKRGIFFISLEFMLFDSLKYLKWYR